MASAAPRKPISPRAFHASRAWILACLAISVAFAPILGFFHFAFVAHEYCAEHGALEHATAHAHGVAHDHHADAHDHPSAPSDSDSPGHAHDPCEVFRAVRAESASIDVDAGSLSVQRTPAIARAPLPDLPPRAVALLRLAPKTPPPQPSV